MFGVMNAMRAGLACGLVALAGPGLARGHGGGAAGSLVSATPIGGAPGGAQGYKVRYRTVDAQGRPITVSGLVVVPRGEAPAGGRDIVSWTHGAVGIAETCAPSDAAWRYKQVAGLPALLAAGYVVTATDYQGLGNPGPHPFLDGEATAHVVLDSVRAARRVPGAKASTRFALWGESQGGHAALWAGREARRYAPELELAGVAAAVPPTDLKANLTGGTNAAVRALLTSFAAQSWSQVHGLPLTSAVKPHTAKLITALAKNCITLDGFRMRTKIGLLRLAGQLRGVDLAAHPRWATLMTRNSLTPTGLTMPLLVMQGSKDMIVAPAVTKRFVDQLCRHRATVTYVTDNGDHVTAGQRGAAVAVSWDWRPLRRHQGAERLPLGTAGTRPGLVKYDRGLVARRGGRGNAFQDLRIGTCSRLCRSSSCFSTLGRATFPGISCAALTPFVLLSCALSRGGHSFCCRLRPLGIAGRVPGLGRGGQRRSVPLASTMPPVDAEDQHAAEHAIGTWLDNLPGCLISIVTSMQLPSGRWTRRRNVDRHQVCNLAGDVLGNLNTLSRWPHRPGCCGQRCGSAAAAGLPNSVLTREPACLSLSASAGQYWLQAPVRIAYGN